MLKFGLFHVRTWWYPYVFHSFLFHVSHSLIYSILMRACTLSHFSHVWLFTTPLTAGYQAPLSMEFSRQEYEVHCHFLLQGIFLTQGLNLRCIYLLCCQMGSLQSEPPGWPSSFNILDYFLFKITFKTYPLNKSQHNMLSLSIRCAVVWMH